MLAAFHNHVLTAQVLAVKCCAEADTPYHGHGLSTASGGASVSALRGSATQGRIRPSVFSSALRPGQGMRCSLLPLTRRAKQVRQVPVRQDQGSATPAASPASSSVWLLAQSKRCPVGSHRIE